MNGQWIGNYTGSNGGNITLNLDKKGKSYIGVAYVNDKVNELPNLAAGIEIQPDNDGVFSFRTTDIHPINPTTGLIDSWSNVKRQFGKDIIIPKYADVNGSYDAKSIKMNWKTDIETYGACELPKSMADQPSNLTPDNKSWDEFKKECYSGDLRQHVYRGQSRPWRLRTSFHRTGRTELHRFINEDIQMLYKHLSARTKHVFNLDIPNENGAFFNLVQHHGYPTPLLDWTYSPFVAAFFAYREAENKASENNNDSKVRIYVFDQLAWKKEFIQINNLLTYKPHFSINEFIAIENERMIPQQGLSTITNIDDIETYITELGTMRSRTFLKAIDLPLSERRNVLRELSYMGITAGSLFPGLDGACEELRSRNFEL